MDLRNVDILPHYYSVSQPEDGGSMVLRNTVSQAEDGGSMFLRNVGILPHHYTVSSPEEGGSKDLRNNGIVPQYYMTSQARRPRLENHEIRGKLIFEKTCYHSVQNLLSFTLLFTNAKIKIYKTIIVPRVLYECKISFLTLC